MLQPVSSQSSVYQTSSVTSSQKTTAPTAPTAPTSETLQNTTAAEIPLIDTPQQGVATTSIPFFEPPAEDPPTEEEIAWARQMEDKVAKGMTLTDKELALYQEINHRMDIKMSKGTQKNEAPTDQEMNWANQLQQMVQQGYQATQKEIEMFADIFNRYQQTHNPPVPDRLTQAELDWAVELESRILKGYQPTPQELQEYQHIFKELQNQEAVGVEVPQPPVVETSPVSQQEIQWALDLEHRVQQGHQPSPEEVARYEDIAKRIQASQSPQPPIVDISPVSQEEVQWALDLEHRVQQGHQPSPEEVARYEDISKRLQASQSPQTSQPMPPSAPPLSTHDPELQWALQLQERMMTQGYQPTSQEAKLYERIQQAQAEKFAN